MKHNLSSPISYDEELSDSLSTTNSFSHFSTEAGLLYQPLSEMNDSEVISPQSKKIRKKRSAYGKIDDDKRLQLLEAVQQHGETLKSASKRLGINYSSAKSIIHTYRKEGRILKKSVCSFPYATMEMRPFENAFPPENFQVQLPHYSGSLIPFDFEKPPTIASNSGNTGSTSPMKGLVGALGHLGLGSQNKMEEPAYSNPQLSIPQVSNFELSQAPRLPLKEISMSQQQSQQQPQSLQAQPKIPLGNSIMEQPPAHPRELFKHLDNFYMNYSSSPLSGGKGNMYADDSSSRRGNPREFDSFSELINSFQNPNRAEESANKPGRASLGQEGKFMKEENFMLSSNMMNPALENYKNLVEAQWMLTDSLQKQTYINLARFQNGGISPINGWNK